MSLTLPNLVQTPSPNVSSRNGARVRLVVVHDSEGSYASAVAWFAQPRSRVSAHLVMREDGAETTQMVPLSEKAWHVCDYNAVSIGVEGAGFAAKGFSDAWWRGMAATVAWLLHRYGLPCRWAEHGAGEGFCSHHDLGAAGGGHLDPCVIGGDAWSSFVGRVETAYDAFKQGPLPDWALHGLPAPSSILLPAPAAADAGSHGGLPGASSDDSGTVAPYPVGSTPDVQRRLNLAGARPPLVIDGCAGPATFAAIERFQLRSRLTVDGLVGPATWAALERASG